MGVIGYFDRSMEGGKVRREEGGRKGWMDG